MLCSDTWILSWISWLLTICRNMGPPSLQLVCSRAQEGVPVAPTPIEVEAYDSDHEVLDQVTTVPRRVKRGCVLL